MSALGTFFKGQFARIAAGAIDQKVDGRDITRKLEEELDKQLGEATSERIQDGLIFNLLSEMLEGLYEDHPEKLRIKIHNWMEDYNKGGDNEK
jgi:hypothetical protein